MIRIEHFKCPPLLLLLLPRSCCLFRLWQGAMGGRSRSLEGEVSKLIGGDQSVDGVNKEDFPCLVCRPAKTFLSCLLNRPMEHTARRDKGGKCISRRQDAVSQSKSSSLCWSVGRFLPPLTHTERERETIPVLLLASSTSSHVLPPFPLRLLATNITLSLSPFRSSVRPTDRSLAFPENGGGRRGRTMPPPPPPPFLLRDCPLLRHSLPRVLGPPPPTEVGVCLRFPLSSSRNCMRTTARQRRRRSRLLRTYIVLGAATGNNQIRKHGKEKRRRRRRRSERCSLPLLWRIQYMSPGRMGGSRFHTKAEKRAKRKEEEEEAIFGPLLLFLGNK